MPYKYPQEQGWDVPKQKYKLRNWNQYSNSLKDRGRIDLWLDKEAIDNWYEEDQENLGTGAPKQYTDFSIIVCHEIRQVYRLPLRQSEGFINSLFKIMGLNIQCPNYSVLSKRLAKLNIPCPRYSEKDTPDSDVAGMAIDSTGLKRFGRDEWHQEKHKVSAKRSWRKLHVYVDEGLSIQLCKFINKRLTIDLNSIVKFYQKMRHSFIPISNRHSPFCRDIVNCQV